MKLTRTFTTIGVVLALGLSAVPAEAQRRGSGGGAPPAGRGAPPQGQRGGSGGPVYGRGPGGGPSQRPVYSSGHPTAGYAAPRRYAPYSSPYYSRYYPAYGYGYRAPYYGHSYYAGWPVYYGSPYYSFRPWFSIGFGISVGYPVAYPAYGYPYPYASAYPAPYPATYPVPYPTSSYPAPGYPASSYPQQSYPPQTPSGAVSVSPGQSQYGGLSFEITPSNAEVYVDGNLAGHVGDFAPDAQPLTASPGVHRIEIRAAGYRSLAYDVTITAGRVVPFQGILQR